MQQLKTINKNIGSSTAIIRSMSDDDTLRLSMHQRLIVNSAQKKSVIKLNEISHIKSDGNYLTIFTIKEERFTIAKTLKQVTEVLDSTFIRIHQSYIVNAMMIAHYHIGDGLIELDQGVQIPVSRSRRSIVAGILQ